MTEDEAGVGATATPIGWMWVESGILFHTITTSDVITEVDAAEVLALVKGFLEDLEAPAVVDMRSVSYAPFKARQAFAGPLEDTGEIATALVIGSGPSRAMARAFLRLNRPERPIEVFRNLDDAIAWARRYVR